MKIGMRLRVVSWNIHKGIGGRDRLYRLDRVIDVLRHLKPDLCLLQEVSDGWPRTHKDHQVDLVREGLGFDHAAFGREHRFRHGGYGNAIVSRYPIHDEHHLDLTIGRRKKRGALLARVVVRQDDVQRTLVVANLHLGLADRERGAQLERFLDSEPFRGVHHTTPVIVAGDLNDVWGSLGPRFLRPAGFRRAGERRNTFPAYLPLRPLDAIFFRGHVASEGGGPGRAPLVTVASDHLPLFADLWIT